MTVPPRLTLAGVFSQISKCHLDELRYAYDVARDAPDRERLRLEARWQQLEAQVRDGGSLQEEDDIGNVIFDHGEYMGEKFNEAQTIIRYIREAFTIALHHFWERQIATFSKVKRYDQNAAFKWLKSIGLEPQETVINELRLVANVAKHGIDPAAQLLLDAAPKYYDTNRMNLPVDFGDPSRKPDYEFLSLTDEHVHEFFLAVNRSWSLNKP